MAEIKDLVKKDNNELYQKCIDKWGKVAQILMAIEEMSELSTNLLHRLRGRHPTLNSLVEEVADVRIMVEQIEYLYGIDELVLIEKGRKIERLEERVSS